MVCTKVNKDECPWYPTDCLNCLYEDEEVEDPVMSYDFTWKEKDDEIHER